VIQTRSRSPLPIFFAFLLLASALVLAPPARAVTTFGPTTVQAAPGTVSGGTGPLVASDDVRTTVSEADVTAVSDARAWLTPNTDDAAGWAQVNSDPLCPAGVAHWCRLDESPTNDGNTTVVASGTASGVVDVYQLSNWGDTPFDIANIEVSGFVWARRNQSADPSAVISVAREGGSWCAGTGFPLNQAFTNTSTAGELTPCGGPGDLLPWTAEELDLAALRVIKNALTNIATMTATGLVVQYDDSDFQVVAYINFTGASGYSPVLRYEGSRSLSGSDTLQLQVNRDGPDSNPDVWVTLVGNFLGASETGASVTLEPVDIQGGSAQLRVVDTVTDAETGGSFALDQFVIDTQEDEDPNIGGGDATVRAKFRCEYVWYFRGFSCVSHWPADPVRVPRPPYFRWWLEAPDGAMVASADGASVWLSTGWIPWDVSVTRYKVTIQVFRTDTVTGADASFVVADIPIESNNFAWIPTYVLIFLIAAVTTQLRLRKRRLRRLWGVDKTEVARSESEPKWPSVPRGYQANAIATEQAYGRSKYWLRDRRRFRALVSRQVSRGTTQICGVTRGGRLVNVAIVVRHEEGREIGKPIGEAR
jgi:hypothetical protein